MKNELRKKIRKTSPITKATNYVKYLEAALVKQVKKLYDKNFKSLNKEVEEAITNMEMLMDR